MIDDGRAVAALQTVGWIKIHAVVFGCENREIALAIELNAKNWTNDSLTHVIHFESIFSPASITMMSCTKSQR